MHILHNTCWWPSQMFKSPTLDNNNIPTVTYSPECPTKRRTNVRGLVPNRNECKYIKTFTYTIHTYICLHIQLQRKVRITITLLPSEMTPPRYELFSQCVFLKYSWKRQGHGHCSISPTHLQVHSLNCFKQFLASL